MKTTRTGKGFRPAIFNLSHLTAHINQLLKFCSTPKNIFWQYDKKVPYFSDYKTHFPHPQIWEENRGASYSPNVAYLTRWGGSIYVITYFTIFFASKFVVLFSSSKTEVHFMV